MQNVQFVYAGYMNVLWKMNKKNLITSLLAMAVLVVAIVVSLVFLYSGTASESYKSKEYSVSDYKLLPAVPSDAAMVLCMGDLKEAVSILIDSSNVFKVLVAEGGKKAFGDFLFLLKKSEKDLGSLKSSDVIVSVHNSGDLVPLMIIDAGMSPADTTSQIKSVMALAESSKLNYRLLDCSNIHQAPSFLRRSVLLLISSSETLLTASQRHLEGGMSILDKDNFPMAASAMGGADALFISHNYASKLFSTYLQRDYAKYSSFFGTIADWTAFEIKSTGTKGLVLKGRNASYEGASYYSNMLSRVVPGSPKMAEILPASTVFAVSVPTENIGLYVELNEKFLDATGRLDKYRRTASVLKDSVGIEPVKWAKRLDIKEICKAVIMLGDEPCPMVFIRPGKEDAEIILKGTGASNFREYKETVAPYAYKGFAGSVIGNIMSVSDDTRFVYRKGWIIVGSNKAVNAFVSGAFVKETIKEILESSGVLSSRIPTKNVSILSYYAASEDIPGISQIFKPVMADALRGTLAGLTYKPVILTVSDKDILLTADRINISRSAAVPVLLKDTVVNVPSGPFKVKNSGTGRTNLFGQSSNMTLTLKEENGKGIWGVPFKSPICGKAETIDYYANGKLQILFASGSKLYLIDRLGRFVNPFPVDLGKDILIGPAVYDFTGAKGYTAIVLHKDNSIGKYDLHGRQAKGWMGIKPTEKIKALPELLKVKGKRYWLVRTSVQCLIYGFNGGEPLNEADGNKMIKPDSAVEVKDGKVYATCYDGKIRNIKL